MPVSTFPHWGSSDYGAARWSVDESVLREFVSWGLGPSGDEEGHGVDLNDAGDVERVFERRAQGLPARPGQSFSCHRSGSTWWGKKSVVTSA